VEKFLVPLYLPEWLHEPLRKAKRALIPSAPEPPLINIRGERAIEWGFISKEMPSGPGRAVEVGCEQGYLSFLAAQRGFRVVANDLRHQDFPWRHPDVEFLEGDFVELSLAEDTFDLAINCSSVEHVGVAGRYGVEVEQVDGDIQVMDRLARILKAGGLLLMTAPCGRDAVMAPWCRVYGLDRLPKLFRRFVVLREEYWRKNEKNQWDRCGREDALAFLPRNDPSDPHRCAYALGCFVLRKLADVGVQGFDVAC
jgi:SAM-dependent methyltransferase